MDSLIILKQPEICLFLEMGILNIIADKTTFYLINFCYSSIMNNVKNIVEAELDFKCNCKCFQLYLIKLNVRSKDKTNV